MKEWNEQGVEIDLSLLVLKPLPFFNSYGGNVVAAIRDLGEAPAVADLIGGVKAMLDAYESGKIDRLFLVSNEFVNTMTQSPTVEQLLPLQAEASDEMQHHWDYIYEPDAKSY
jgi:F-type H+-transporting ATPase subunit gamma